MIELKDNSHFFVVTGGPGVGKTTMLRELAARNHEVVPEIARELIIEQKDLDGDALPWKNKELFKTIMFERSISSYEQMEKKGFGHNPIFFDRGFLDSICYATLIRSEIDERMNEYALKWRYNRKVFVLPPWKEIYEQDSERKQDWEEAVFTYGKMVETCKSYGYETIVVPKMTAAERADFVLDQIEH